MKRLWGSAVLVFVTLMAMLSITVSAGETSISGDYEYGINHDGTVTLIKYIGEDTEVTIPSTIDGYIVRSIGEAFRKCESVRSVILPSSITVVSECAFWNCPNLETVTIPEGVSSIGSEAFHACYALASVVIPEGVTSIRDEAFSECSSLEEIVLPESLEEIGREAFAQTKITHFRIPENVRELGSALFHNGSLESIEAAENHPSFCVVDDVLFSKDQTELILYPQNREGAVYTVPDSVKSLEYGAFLNSSLKAVVLPNGLEVIENAAFDACTKLAYVNIPEGVTSIGADAFHRCESLTDVVLPSSLTVLESDAFSRCSSLRTVSLPASITSVHRGIFSQCGLETVYFGGTSEQWNEIYIGFFNEGLDTAAVICEASGIPAQIEGDLVYSVLSDGTAALTAYLGTEKQVTIPSSFGDRKVTVIADGVFTDNEITENVIVPEGVELIEKAFWGADALQSVTLPSTIRTIKADAFSFCNELQSIVYNGNSAMWEQIDRETDAFGNDPLENTEISFMGEDALPVQSDSSVGNTAVSDETNNMRENDGGFPWVTAIAVVIVIAVGISAGIVMKKRNRKQ